MSDQIIADGVPYELPKKLTLGEQRVIYQEFGVNLADEIDTSPALVAAFLAVAMKRDQPALSWKTAIARVDSVVEIELPSDEGEDEATPNPPTVPADTASDGA